MDVLLRNSGVSSSPAKLASPYIHDGPSTPSQAEIGEYFENLDSAEVPGLADLVPVIAHAIAVFGDENKAAHWLTNPLVLFHDRSPTEVLEEPGGIDLVEQTLTRIEHNIPS